MQQGILIVAECNVNEIFFPFDKSMLCILIVAECNVNSFKNKSLITQGNILIVAECNVNCADEETSDALETF